MAFNFVGSNNERVATVALTGNYNDLINKPTIPSPGTFNGTVVFSNRGKITSGTCTYPTIVNVMCPNGSQRINVNGVQIWCTDGYHGDYHTGSCFCVPAGGSWSMSGASIDHTTYAEFR